MSQRKPRPGEAPRVPLDRVVSLRFKLFSDFLDELSTNVSIGGMFIRTPTPHPVGAVFEFEIRLEREPMLVAGKAQVAWVRRRAAGEERPPGMGVRFVELDDDSRRTIQRLVAARLRTGGKPPKIEARTAETVEVTVEDSDEAAAIEESPPEPAEIPPATAASEPPPVPAVAVPPAAPARSPAVPTAAASTEPRRYVAAAAEHPGNRTWVLLTVVLAAALVAALWLRPAGTGSGSGSPSDQPAAGPAPVAVSSPAASAAADRSAARDPAAADSRASDPGEEVEAWARAWSEQRIDDYLAAYSPRFEPANGLSRPAWEIQRRARISTPNWIEVGLAFVEVEETGPRRSRVRFVQAYDSDTYNDVVRKVLELEREDDRWRIVREVVEP